MKTGKSADVVQYEALGRTFNQQNQNQCQQDVL